jgi:hypothetical protein
MGKGFEKRNLEKMGGWVRGVSFDGDGDDDGVGSAGSIF